MIDSLNIYQVTDDETWLVCLITLIYLDWLLNSFIQLIYSIILSAYLPPKYCKAINT